MSVLAVADLLAVAHEGYITGVANKDATLTSNSLLVVAKALQHPDAGAFFKGVAAALTEDDWGNDPTIEHDDTGVLHDDDEEGPDEDSNAASPAYEGLVDGENDDGRLDDGSDEENQHGPDVNRKGEMSAVAKASANWARLKGVEVAADPNGRLMSWEFKTREGAAKRCAFENVHSSTHEYSIEKVGEVWKIRKKKR